MKTETNSFAKYLFTFDSEKFNKSYVLYYPISAEDDEDEEIEIHASSFVPSEDNKDGELSPVETEEEWDVIEEMLNTFLDEEEAKKNKIYIKTDLDQGQFFSVCTSNPYLFSTNKRIKVASGPKNNDNKNQFKRRSIFTLSKSGIDEC